MALQLDAFGKHPMPVEMVAVEEMAAKYPWKEVRAALEARFRLAAVSFHARETSGQPGAARDPVLYPLLDLAPAEGAPQAEPVRSFPEGIVAFFRKRNPKGAGRKPQPFLAYLKAFILAPVLHVEPDTTRLAETLRTNPYLLSLCGFSYPPAPRTLQDFDQIMRETGLWNALTAMSFQKNVQNGIIDRAKEDTANVDPTELPADSTPGRKTKKCRQCPFVKTCPHPELTDPTAGWYQKSRYKGSHAHMVTFTQLAQSGAPLSFVVQNGKVDERDSLKPVLEAAKRKHPDFDVKHVNADGIFNTERCHEEVQDVYPGAQLHTPVHAGRRKELEQVARGIEKITPKGTVICEAGQSMVLLGQDHRTESYCFVCPVYNPRARAILEKRGAVAPPCSCDLKNVCCPTSTQGRFVRIPRKLLPQLDPDTPQGGYRFWWYYHLRTKIERLFARLKERYRMVLHNLRGQLSIEALCDRLSSTMHILAAITGTYGV